MSEDFTIITDWVEVEPLDLFSVLSSNPALSGLSDNEGRAALEAIRTARAQFVVDEAMRQLKSKESGLNQQSSAAEAELEELDREYFKQREILVARIQKIGRDTALITDAYRIGGNDPQDTNIFLLSSATRRLVGLIERPVILGQDELLMILDELGQFKINMPIDKNDTSKRPSLRLAVEQYKRTIDSNVGHKRSRTIKALEKAAMRFDAQAYIFTDSDGFKFIEKLAEVKEDVINLEFDSESTTQQKRIVSFIVTDPRAFAVDVLLNLRNAGVKTVLGLRLIAELQKDFAADS